MSHRPVNGGAPNLAHDTHETPHSTPPARHPTRALRTVLALLLLTAGCAGPRLRTAREDFYLGQLSSADAALENLPAGRTDRVLALMERGMIRQLQGRYEPSTQDWLEAMDLAEELHYYSVSRGATSFAVNDRVLAFRGAPYERTLLHAFTALNYFARSLWDDAAVEARRIVADNQDLNGYPDVAYGHYLAGVCFELAGDADGAAREYRACADLATTVPIDATTGRIGSGGHAPAELICFVSLGRAPADYDVKTPYGAMGPVPYAEIVGNGRILGRSYVLSDTYELRALTDKREAAIRAAKTAARVAAKEAAAQAVGRDNEFLGDLTRLILFALEVPDNRCWETLPRWLQVARVPCPADLTSYEIIVRNAASVSGTVGLIQAPLTRRRNTFVTFCRDLPTPR